MLVEHAVADKLFAFVTAVVWWFAESILIEGGVIFFRRDGRGCVRSSHLIVVFFIIADSCCVHVRRASRS